MKFQLSFFVFFVVVLLAVAAEDAPAVTVTEKVCEAGKEFNKDCATCKCNAEGTQFTCEKKETCTESQKVSEPDTETEEKCTPGEHFKVKCNECKCPESGMKSQAACTIIGCPDQ